QPRQAHLKAQMILRHVDRSIGGLAQRADPERQIVAVPDFFIERHQMAEARSRLAETSLETADSLLLAEAVGDRDDQRSRHRRLSICFRSSAMLRRLARHITSKASPSNGTAPTTPPIDTLATIRTTRIRR